MVDVQCLRNVPSIRDVLCDVLYGALIKTLFCTCGESDICQTSHEDFKLCLRYKLLTFEPRQQKSETVVMKPKCSDWISQTLLVRHTKETILSRCSSIAPCRPDRPHQAARTRLIHATPAVLCFFFCDRHDVWRRHRGLTEDEEENESLVELIISFSPAGFLLKVLKCDHCQLM